MDYKMSWFDLKQWIENSISHLTILMDKRKEKEFDRIKNKREGFQVVLQYMLETEKIYKTDEDELDEKLQKMTKEEFIEFFSQIDDDKNVESLLKKFEK